jgi:hypothetical protein
MPETESVLAANEAFYSALLTCDFELMEELWATDAPVNCIHPGWHNLVGREAVMESWRAILINNAPPNMTVHEPGVTIYDDLAVVICSEVFPEMTLVATNIFIREDGDWKMILHQAGGSVQSLAKLGNQGGYLQ